MANKSREQYIDAYLAAKNSGATADEARTAARSATWTNYDEVISQNNQNSPLSQMLASGEAYEENGRFYINQQKQQEDESWTKAQAARTASQERGETGEQWYTNSKTKYDAATKLLADLKKTKASNTEIEEAAKRLAEAEEDYGYSKYFRFSDIANDKDYKTYVEKGKSILNSKSDVGEQIANGTYSPTGNKILDFFYRLNGSTMANGYGGSGSGQAMNAAVAASAQDTTDQVIDEKTWSEDEKNTYLYLLGRDGEAAASEYAIDVNAGYAKQAQQAQQEKISDWSTKSALNGVLGTAATIVGAATPIGLGNFFSMAAELAGKGRISQKDSLTPVQISSTVQSAIATSLNEKYGTIGENVPVVGGKGWGDAYQLANSIATSWASIASGGEAGSLMFFFGNAASQGVQEAMDRGLSPEKAVALGFANGLAEVLGEKFSVENLIHMKSSRTLGQFLKSIGVQAGIEGSEEGFTTFLNTLADRLISGDMSEYNQKVDNLMGQGMTYEEAKKQALKESVNDLAFDILGGAISGGVSAAGGSFIQNMAYNGDSQLLFDTAKQVGSDQDVLRAAQIEKAVAESKNGQLKRGEAGELMGIIEENGGTEAYTNAAVQKATNQSIGEALKDLGLSDSQKEVLVSGYSTGTADPTTYAFGVREAFQLGKMGLSLETATERAKLGAELNETQFRHAWQLGAGQKSVTDTDVADVATPEGKERLASALSMLGEHAQAAADAYDGKQDVARFAAAMNKAANLYAANGVDVKALAQELQESGSKDIISYLSEEQLEAAAKIGAQIRAQNEAESKKSSARLTTLREQAAAILAAGGRSTQALNNIDKAIAAASKYGQQEYSLYQEKLSALEEMVKADPEAENTEAYQKAYEEAEEHYQNAVEARKGIDNLEEKRKELQSKQPIKRKKGTVSFEGGTDPNTGKQLKAVDQTKLSKHQKNVVSMVEALADIINIDYVFFDGDSNTGGEYIGDGVIYININSGVTRNFAQGIAAASLSHELTHFMQEYAPEEYNELKDFIVSEIMKKSPSEFDALVKQQLAWQPDLTYAQAVDEVIANSCQNMLLNSQYIAQFAREHMTAAEKIKDTIHDIVDKIKAAYEGIDFKSDQGPFRAVQAVIDQSEMIQKRWDKALEAATKNYNAEQTAGSQQQESGLKAAAQTTGVKYQKTTPENDSIRIQLQQAQDELNKKEPVANVRAENVPKNVSKAVPWAVERLKHTGYKVERKNFGTIIFDEGHIREALRHITGKPDEIGAILALPRVLKRGDIIESHGKHQGRVQDSYTIAAPITVNGVRGNMAVVVHRTTKNFFHAYRVLLPDNSNFTFESENKKAGSKRTGELPDNRALIAESVETASDKNVPEKTQKVKGKFQMMGPVEETNRLVAVHNKSVSGLRRMLERNGVPFPSIAIKKAGTSHEGFGDVSIVFPRSSIDPEVNRQNRLYSNDAWTPTEPVEEYDVGDMWRYQKKIKQILGDEIYTGLKAGSYLEESDLARKLQYSRGDIFTALKDQSALKYAYLKSEGREPALPMTQERLDGFGKYKNEQLLAVFSALSKEEIENMDFDSEETLKKVADILEEQFESQFDEERVARIRKHPVYTADKINPNVIKDAYRKYQDAGNTIKSVPDYYAFDRDMKYNMDVENEPGYKAWIENQFKDLIVAHGIPNGKDLYTSSGNRRSFKARHIPATLENIVAQMQKEQERGNGVMGINLRGAATKAYRNVEEMRADSGKLLGKHISDDVYDSYMKGFYERLHNMSQSAMKGDRNSWEGLDSTEEILLTALRDAKSEQNMDSLLRKEAQWIKYSPELVHDLWQLRNDVQNMPAPYFEAKPRRIVYPGEALAFILPDNAPSDVIGMLNDRGYNVMTYEAGNEADRLAKLNSVEEAKFQKWDSTKDDTAYEAEGRELAYARIQSENKALSDTVAALKKLTGKQENTIAKLEKRLKLTKTQEVRESDAKRLANQLIRDNSSVADKAQIAADLKALGDYILQTDAANLSEDEIKQRARAIASEIVENAEVISDLGGELATWQSIASDLKGRKLTIDGDFLGDLDVAGGYEAFRKQNFGNFTLAKRETGEARADYKTVGEAYMEMQQSWGKAYFPDVANEGEQIRVIADMFQRAKGTIVNPNSQYMGEATEALANQIAFDVMDGILRPTEPTTADKYKARTDALKEQIAQLKKEGALSDKEADALRKTIYDLTMALDKAESRFTSLRVSADVRTDQLRAEGIARAAEMKANERARAEKQIAALKDHYREVAQRARDRREENAGASKYRKQIDEKAKKLFEMLMKNSDKEHIPEVLKGPLADFLTTLDFSSKRLLRGGEETKRDVQFGARLMQLQQILAGQQDYINGDAEGGVDLGGYIDVSPESLQFLKDAAQQITAAMATGNEYTINQMSADQLRSLSNFLSSITKAIKNMNSFMANERFASVQEAASQDIERMDKLGKASEKEGNVLRRLFKWENGTPYYVFRRFGNGGVSIFEGLTKGWDKMAFNVQEIINFTEKLYTSKEVNEWKSTIHDITLEDGSKIQMTTAQLMELSMLLNREQAMKHIQKGGIRVGDITTKKGKLTDVNHYHLSYKDISNMLKLLDGRQMEVAKALQSFMATKGAEWGNEISMRRFGYNFYTEGENYFPIKTDANDRPMADTDAQQNSMFRLLNLSSSKSLNPKASNALIVGDIFDTFSDHMADQAKLNGLGLPILDAIKWFNFKERIDLEEGGYNTRTLQAAMEQAFGSDAQKYFRTLMKDVNGLTESGDRGKELYSKMTSNYKVAAVAANLRVALLQPTSYVRASFLIDPKYLAAAFMHKNAYQDAMKYSGTAVWKSLGYYDTNIARNMRDQIQHNDNWKDNLVEKTMIGAELGDKLTWGRLWVACKLQTQAQNKGLSEEELNQKTADLFREVVYSSQVMDSTLTRSSLMRSSSGFNKMLTPFMAEPTLSYNILLDAFSTYQLDARENGKGGAWARNGKKIGKAFAVYAASAAFASLAESLWDAVRDADDEAFLDKFLDALLGEKADDDEDETAKDSFFKFLLGKKALGGRKWLSGNLWQDIDILQKLPYLKNVISLLQGFGNSDMLTSGFNIIMQSYKIWAETLSLEMGYLDKPTNVTYYGHMTPWGKIYKSLQGLSQVTGIPVAAGLRDAFAIWNTVVGGTNPDWKIRTYDADQLTQSNKAAFNEYVKTTGISEREYAKILKAANADGNSNVTQAELSEYLKAQLEAGSLTKDQADALWDAQGWKKTYDQYTGAEKKTETPAPAATTEPVTTPKPKAKLEATNPEDAKQSNGKKITTYDEFKKNVKLYSDKKDTAYQLWESTVRPLGIDLDTYTRLLNDSDTNGNNSVTQDELGETLTKAIRNKEISDGQASAIWYTLWNGGRSKTYDSWAAKHGYRDMTNESWMELQEINEARGDNYILEGTPVTQEEYDEDYLSRGYYPNRTGEVRTLEEWDPMRDRNEALDNAFLYFGEGNSAAPELFDEAFIDWYENPDYEGQTFENYLNNYGDMTPAARRIFSGTGQKAVRREALDYAFWEAVGTGRGRK